MISRIDANCKFINQTRVGLNQYSVFAGILIPTGESYTDEQLRNFLDDLWKGDITVLWQGSKRMVYQVVGRAHRLTSHSSPKLMFDKNNLAVFLEDNLELFIGSEFGQDEAEVKRTIVRFYRGAIEDDPIGKTGLAAKYGLVNFYLKNLNNPSLVLKEGETENEFLNQAEVWLNEFIRNASEVGFGNFVDPENLCL